LKSARLVAAEFQVKVDRIAAFNSQPQHFSDVLSNHWRSTVGCDIQFLDKLWHLQPIKDRIADVLFNEVRVTGPCFQYKP
jgi:hypothetical protein